MNLFDDDDAFVGTPKSNFYSIARLQIKYLEMEVDKILRRLPVAERILDEKGLRD